MKEIKKYLSRVFIIIALAMVIILSVIDSVFDEIANTIADTGIMILALILYFSLHIYNIHDCFNLVYPFCRPAN